MAGRDGRAWRGVKAFVVLFAVTIACGVLIVGDQSPLIRMYAVHVAVEPSELDRDARTLPVMVVGAGYCVGFGQKDEQSRFDHFDVDVENRSVLITAWIREQPGVEHDTVCAGVGSPSFAKTVELPEPIGDRALISRTYPRVPKRVLALPRGETAAADRFSEQSYSYEGDDCRAAREHFTGRPEDWCAKLF